VEDIPGLPTLGRDTTECRNHLQIVAPASSLSNTEDRRSGMYSATPLTSIEGLSFGPLYQSSTCLFLRQFEGRGLSTRRGRPVGVVGSHVA